ncbi:hypothetical protein [Nocardioides lacusdianchii]|uniref:hypothetical protein n=1 Tax=Nocardioides lacusdianchii TaxID=2783664 RepID=UPI001CC9979B|nr:hypothetical protein [Nocardioides lacusdianchii]
MTPLEFFDASAPVTDRPSTTEVLTELGGLTAERELLAALDDLDDLVATASEHDRDDPVPQELVVLLRELTGADGAPVAWSSLNRRVRDGLTTWDAFWADPSAEQDGVRLVHEVLGRFGAALGSALGAHGS